jgi:hypothetical protein
MSSPSPRLDINVLPENYRKPWLQRKQILILLVMVILIALTVPLYQLVSTAIDQTAEMEEQSNTLNQQVERIKTTIAQNAEKLDLIDEYETISQKRDVLRMDVEAIKSAAEQFSIEIKSISYKSDKIMVSCIGGDPDYGEFTQLLGQYREALIETERFSTVTYPTPTYPLSASITIEIER